ncbi:MAG: tRNA preQ1(34) S-adenosylmethionine ribosyltransferase-isomerase QueA [Planctomycetes bacterium]|nr:tRNA preQ1(34) S-adenosylmethionine ribosyltransferase-isomerase QueA [Planctomycetota bacterium]
MKLSLFDYELPGELIAQHPLENRDTSRLFVLDRAKDGCEHKSFSQITDYFSAGDVLVINDTKVIPARIIGRRITGGLVNMLLTRELSCGVWEIMVQTRGKDLDGEQIFLDCAQSPGGKSVSGTLKRIERGKWEFVFDDRASAEAAIYMAGRAPLPPYIKRAKSEDPFVKEDLVRYQTVYAQKAGSIAAPTAGLHFTDGLLEQIRKKGVIVCHITLHVGKGTFKPVETEEIESHSLDQEFFSVERSALMNVLTAKAKGRRVFAVGTTCCRTLEWMWKEGLVEYGNSAGRIEGWTNLFICPGYEFRAVDCLITNFHLPKGTPLMLASALAGRERILDAYKTAIKEKYRFFSYGDAMLII